MTTQRQIAANRANAQKSTGPKSQAGKLVSGSNALRHGLTTHLDAQSIVNWLRIILNDPNAELDPTNPDKRIVLAHRLAEAEARLIRVQNAEAEYLLNRDPEGRLENDFSNLDYEADMMVEVMEMYGENKKGLRLLARIDKFDIKQKHRASVAHIREMRKLARYRSEAEAQRRSALKKWIDLESGRTC